MDDRASYGIIYCARHSCVGEMIYRKYNRKRTGYESERKLVVPLSVGRTRRGREVLFAEDTRDGHRVKMFLLDCIQRFELTRRKVRTSFPIEVMRIFGRLAKGRKEDDFDDGDGKSGGTEGAPAEGEESGGIGRAASKMRRVVAAVMQFSGAEANQYREEGVPADEYDPVD